MADVTLFPQDASVYRHVNRYWTGPGMRSGVVIEMKYALHQPLRSQDLRYRDLAHEMGLRGAWHCSSVAGNDQESMHQLLDRRNDIDAKKRPQETSR